MDLGEAAALAGAAVSYRVKMWGNIPATDNILRAKWVIPQLERRIKLEL